MDNDALYTCTCAHGTRLEDLGWGHTFTTGYENTGLILSVRHGMAWKHWVVLGKHDMIPRIDYGMAWYGMGRRTHFSALGHGAQMEHKHIFCFTLHSFY
ncbi:hypothetical protein VTL71DRAFT_2159 [Oculimacula yallundae]|uniref:Uncharacterized protein n=1 Tax=Oculimacula yallundae TaxID=86028 RepID=A0ABR4C845_9HELO